MTTQKVELRCNAADRDGHCNANDGEPCVRCEAASVAEAAYWRRQWNAGTYEEKHGREKYESELRDAGRGVR